ncbi:bifunctional metallophosphatase/5'-nucleotidase [Acidaminococcus sp.]|uniref:bifunctional metallophosphatase/5'-nucleotidase n=1 Tax=Acidaminococcus sp. TaxID=1872103 RepID=UPI003D7CF8B4
MGTVYRMGLMSLGLGISLVVLSWLAVAQAAVTVLHTNDIHCGVGQNLTLARVAALKKQLEGEGKAVLLVDAGDAIQGEPLGSLTKGRALVQLLNRAGYDFAVPGNHEFDYGMDAFLERARELKCGYTSCNFLRTDTGRNVLPGYRLFSFKERKVALVGVTTPGTLVSSTPRFFQDTQGRFIYGFCEDRTGEKLARQVQKTVDEARRSGADTVLLVGHLGSDGVIPEWSSATLLQRLKGVDGAIDGHSHEVYVKRVPDRDGTLRPLVQTGTKLQSVGRLVIQEDGTIWATQVAELPPPEPGVEKAVAKELARVDRALSRPVGRSSVELVQELDGKRAVRTRETNLTDFLTDAFRHTFKAQVGLVNGGSIRAGLPRGEWSRKTLMTLFPFGNQAVLRSVTGQQLLDALEMGASLLPEENGGLLHTSGLTYTIDVSLPSGVELDAKGNFVRIRGSRRVRDVQVDGKPLDPEEDYLVAGPRYILGDGGNGMTMLSGTPLVAEPGLSDVDVLAAYVRALDGQVGPGYENPRGQGRLRQLTGL